MRRVRRRAKRLSCPVRQPGSGSDNAVSPSPSSDQIALGNNVAGMWSPDEALAKELSEVSLTAKPKEG